MRRRRTLQALCGLLVLVAGTETGFSGDKPPPQPPTIASVYPKLGCPQSPITISGQHFQKEAKVTIGGNPCTEVVVKDPTSLTCTTPIRAAGPADVQVTNPDQKKATLTNGFTYYVESVLIRPMGRVVTAGTSSDFGAFGGGPPYSYSIVSGAGSVDSKSGRLSLPDNAEAGLTTVAVADFFGTTSEAMVVVNPPPKILGGGRTIEVGSAIFFSASGGTPPYSYSASGAGSVDAGSGRFVAASAPGTAKVTVTDSFRKTSEATVTVNSSLAIIPAGKTLAVGNAFRVNVTGGAPPYSYSTTGGGDVDPKSGEFTASTAGDFKIKVTDSGGNSAESTVRIEPALSFSGSWHVTVSGSTELKVVGGVPPLTYALEAGEGSVDPSTGRYSTPPLSGTAVIRVKDNLENSIDVPVVIHPTLLINPPAKRLAVNRVLRFTAFGGFPPYKYEIASGIGTLDGNTGLFIAAGTPGEVTVKVSDSTGGSATSTLSVIPPTDALALGYGHTCLLLRGKVTCWGENDKGQIGAPVRREGFKWAQVPGVEESTMIVSGQHHTCVLTLQGGVKCWGFNVNGQLGSGSNVDSFAPVEVRGMDRGVTAITAGQYHTCALVNHAVECWGNNLHGQLGDGKNQNRNVPAPVFGLQGVVGISAGVYHTCALLENGTVKCWGSNINGQLGDGTFISRQEPVEVTGLKNVEMIVAGGFHTCALNKKKDLFCWGDDYYGQLGDLTKKNRPFAGPVKGIPRGTQVLTAGVYHTCAQYKGTVKCWGFNQYGQLGNVFPEKQEENQSPILDVKGLSCGVQGIGAGTHHTCAIVFGGVRCWGDNSEYQLGSVAPRMSFQPISVAGPVVRKSSVPNEEGGK